MRTDSNSLVHEPYSPGHHKIAGIIAIVISIVLHTGLLVRFSDLRFGLTIASPEQIRQRRVKSIRLGEVRRTMLVKNRRDAKSRGELKATDAESAEVAALLGLKPDMGTMAPPAVPDGEMLGENQSVVAPSTAPTREAWQPRREVLIVESRVAADEVRGMKRWQVPDVARVRQTPDIVPPTDVTMIRSLGIPRVSTGGPMRGPTVIQVEPSVITQPREPTPVATDTNAVAEVKKFPEPRKDVTEYEAIENVLQAKVTTVEPFGDFKYGYFRIEVDRAGEELLPVIPKDIIFVQDCSASMAEQRLYFCRQGLTNSLALLGKEDRFNVIGFRDAATLCFKDWAKNSPQNAETARQFILNMTSAGNTDIFYSIKALSNIKREPGRPVVVILVTDGRSTTGLTRSSDIIGEFSKLNQGAVSVFTMGTMQLANTYLLDLLSYCNRGDTVLVDGGRWGIADTLSGLVRNVSRPVLADMTCRFAEKSGCEVYPVQTSNLYLDRTFVLHGRYPRGLDRIVFQVKGKAEKKKCDMVFDLDLGPSTRRRDKTIRIKWAEQKIYHLMGQYARTPGPTILQELRETSKAYRVKVPYQESL